MLAEFRSVHSYWNFARQVTRSHRYIREPEVEEFLSTLLETSDGRKGVINRGAKFWRAQLGHAWESLYQEDEYIDDIPGPFPPERMKPFKDRAREGRANPKGIPYLYGSNRKETALSEVRPWIGSLISLGLFEIQRDLKVIDFSTEDRAFHLYFEEPETKEKERVVWVDIDRAFSKPVTPNDEVADYVPTQIIAELFKSRGFDGIVYGSTFGAGKNIVLFDLESAALVNCSLYEIKDIRFDFRQTSNTYSVAKRTKENEENALTSQSS